MPLQRRLPKRGFKSAQLQFNAEVTLADLNTVDAAEIDILVLKQAGLVAQLAKRVKVIKTGELKPHFAYGALSHEEYAAAHVLHLYNHLSLIRPA